MAIYNVYKELGETPLECLERTRVYFGIPEDVSMTYVGRLDPAATGAMIILTEDDIKNKINYLGLDKIYEVEFIVGIKTDTADLLGKLQKFDNTPVELNTDSAQGIFDTLTGERQQRFHSFSSKVVDGQPLWLHAKEGRFLNVTHKINIKRIDVISVSHISVSDILIQVNKIANLVNGDFRQKEILESWNIVKSCRDNLLSIKINTHASSGTYMRVLAEEFGELISRDVCVYSIERKEIII